MEYEPWSSKSGFHVVPALSVRHSPPLPTATYQVLGSPGSTAMSAIRPAISAGPIPRRASPSNVFSLIAVVLSRSSFCFRSDFAPSAVKDSRMASKPTTTERMAFMATPLPLLCSTREIGRSSRRSRLPLVDDLS